MDSKCEYLTMVEEHAKPAGENLIESNDGTKGNIEKDNTTTTKSSKDSIGCVSLFNPAPSCSEYFSPCIGSIMKSRSEYGSNLETEIEASKVHWSELQAKNGAEGLVKKNLEVFRSLQQQYYKGPHWSFFVDSNDDRHALGEKIAEGAQAEIFKLRWLLPERAHLNDTIVLEVFKERSSLQDVQKQWPPDILCKATASENKYYLLKGAFGIASGVMLNNRRFAFLMVRYWGDLWKVIDLRMEFNRNQAPSFSNDIALQLMYAISKGMRTLHKDNIVHRDSKASNLLIHVVKSISLTDFNPTSDHHFCPLIANFECSIEVLGTGYWRAPEILLGVKNQPSLFTKKIDIYSNAMTCYEILT